MQRSIGELLAHHDAFRGLARPDLDLVAGCGHNTVFEAGQYLFREGETAETFYVVREGRIAGFLERAEFSEENVMRLAVGRRDMREAEAVTC